jgi:hypothetical protein
MRLGKGLSWRKAKPVDPHTFYADPDGAFKRNSVKLPYVKNSFDFCITYKL